jgi:hypothetical protein
MTNNRTGREISLRIVPPATLVSRIGYSQGWGMARGLGLPELPKLESKTLSPQITQIAADQERKTLPLINTDYTDRHGI